MERPTDFRTPVAELAKAASAAESKFLGIGQTLEQAIDILARQSARVGSLRAGMESAALTGAIDTLARSAAGIAALAGQHSDEQVSLDRLATIAGAVDQRITAMLAVTREVDMLALNARLVAAGMGETGLDFMAFAAEIRRSAQVAIRQLDSIRAELNGVAQHLRAARAAVSEFTTRHCDAIASIPTRLAANIGQVSARGHLAVVAAAQVGTRSEDIRREVAVQIAALQFGDISRQRIEHVRDAAALLADAAPGATDALAGYGRRLLVAQLRDIADEIDSESESIVTGLTALATAARDIHRIASHAFGASDRQVGSFLAELESDVRQTQALVANLQQADAEVVERAGAVLETTHRLVRHVATVRAVEADIRIMGLNTTLKCSRLGATGRPLSVVAQALREYGGQTAAQAAAVLKALDEMTGLAGSLGTADGTRRQGGLDAAADMGGAIATLESLGETLSDVLAGLETESDQVAGVLGQAAAGFAVRHEIGGALRRIATGFAGQDGDADGSVDERGQQLLAQIAASYTMTRERDVHAAVVPWAAPPSAPAPAAVELEDMLF